MRWGEKALPRFIDKNAALALPDGEPVFGDMRNMIPASDIEIIVKRAMALSRNPALGLTLGFDAPDRLLQLVSYVAMSSGNLVEACEAFQRYSPLLGDGFWLKLEQHRHEAKLIYWFHSGLSADLERFWSDFVAATALRRWYVSNRSWVPSGARTGR